MMVEVTMMMMMMLVAEHMVTDNGRCEDTECDGDKSVDVMMVVMMMNMIML